MDFLIPEMLSPGFKIKDIGSKSKLQRERKVDEDPFWPPKWRREPNVCNGDRPINTITSQSSGDS